MRLVPALALLPAGATPAIAAAGDDPHLTSAILMAVVPGNVAGVCARPVAHAVAR